MAPGPRSRRVRAAVLAASLALAVAPSSALRAAGTEGAEPPAQPKSAEPPARPEGAEAPAQRIVSLNPSLTAILVALGASDRLVGVDVWSKRQNPSLASLPTVGGLYNPSLEALAAAGPDLVMFVPSAEQREFQSRLSALGVRAEAFDPVRFDEVLDSIERIGRITGTEARAQQRTARIRAVRAELERAVAGQPRPRTVLVLQREPLFVVGGGNFIDEMLASVGATNVAAGWNEPYPRVSLEWLVAQAPEVILDASRDSEPPEDYWSRWPSLPAVASGRVVRLPQGEATLPGPALDDALRLLARSVHGAALTAAASPR